MRLMTGLAAAILLTGCAATHSTSTAPFKPEGGSGASAPSNSASTTAIQASTETFAFGNDVHFDFQTPLPSDPDQRAAVIDSRDYILAYFYGLYNGGNVSKGIDLILPMQTSVKVALSNSVYPYRNQTFTGTTVVYDTTIEATSGASGDWTVASCVNEAKTTAYYRSNHKVVPGQNQIPADNTWWQSQVWVPYSGAYRLGAIQTVPYRDGGDAKKCL